MARRHRGHSGPRRRGLHRQPGNGFFNTATLTVGAVPIDDDACIPVVDLVYPTITKTVTSTNQDPATGDWTIMYDVDVALAPTGPANPLGLSAEYGLEDTLDFGGDINIGSAEWTGESSGTFASPTATAILATDKEIEQGETEKYTITVVAEVTSEAVDGGTPSATRKKAAVEDSSTPLCWLRAPRRLPVEACAEPLFPEIVKDGGVTTDNLDGTWGIEYFIEVSYPDSSLVPLPTSIGYDLADAPALPAGVELVGSWSAAADDGDTPDPTDGSWSPGDSPWLVVDNGSLTPDNDVHTYVISATVRVTAPPAEDPALCDDTQSSGILIVNVGTVTSGGYVADDDGCQVVQFDDVGIDKVHELLPERRVRLTRWSPATSTTTCSP